MATRTILIDGGAQAAFSFSLAGGNLTVRGSSSDPGVLLRDLHIKRVRCEIEILEEAVAVSRPDNAPAGGGPLPRELQLGDSLRVGSAVLRLALTGAAPPSGAAAVPGPPAAAPPAPAIGPSPVEQKPATSVATPAAVEEGMVKLLRVVDGADQGKIFVLAENGTLAIGKSHKHADITLNDLYVSRVHCELQIDGDDVLVNNVRSQTLVNCEAITERPLRMGEVLRVGNTHLRLEMGFPEDPEVRSAGTDEFDPASDADNVERPGRDDVAVSAEASPSGKSFPLPHAPVDELLQLEGQTLGHFEIGPLLGRGQSSLVFRALDIRRNATVALKVLSPEFPADDAELQHFVQALKAVPPLAHPNLVNLHGAGRTGAYCWIAREYIDGENAGRLIGRIKDGEQLDWSWACRIAIHVGKALDFIHNRGVTHRGISPRNMLVAREDQTTKLTDLMLLQALEGSRLEDAIRMKRYHLQLPYTAPEQVDTQPAGTPAADLYSLGCVLYALLTGQPPFNGNSPREILAQARQGKVVKPRKSRPQIPIPFEAAVLKLMARAPEERFPAAGALLEVVEPIAILHEIKV